MDPILDHHDGHGLNERVSITRDERDPNAGGASHHYRLMFQHGPDDEQEVGFLQFQHGARSVEGSKSGLLEGALIAVLLDRLRAFQAGPYPSRQNAIALTKLEEALFWIKDRAHERARRGVLGTNTK